MKEYSISEAARFHAYILPKRKTKNVDVCYGFVSYYEAASTDDKKAEKQMNKQNLFDPVSKANDLSCKAGVSSRNMGREPDFYIVVHIMS